MFGLERKVERAARKAAAFSVGGLLATVGAAFLTLAGWLVLVELRSEVFAAFVIGAVYIGAAAIVMALGTARRPAAETAAPSSQTADLSPMQMVAVSFLQGLEQGRQARHL